MPDSIDLVKKPEKGGHSMNLVPKDNDYNNVFGSYSLHTYQNFTKIFQTDVNFFIMVPRSLLPYYYYIVLQQLFWYRGFVPGLHNSNVVSQQLGGWICNTIATLTASGGFHIEAEDEELENDLMDLVKNRYLHDRLRRRLPMLNAGGFTLAYATHERGSDLTDISKYNIQFVDCNRHFAKLDANGKVMGFTAHLKTITPDPITGEEGYYLIHQRWIDKLGSGRVCYERYSVYKGPSWITTPVFEQLSEQSCAELSSLPEDVQESFQAYLGNVPLNKTILAPYDISMGCGAAIIHNSSTADGVEEYDNFSNGTLFHAINQLYEFEMTKAQKMVNKYMSVTKVLLPDNFYSPPAPKTESTDPDKYQAQLAGYHASFHEKMGHHIFKRVPYISSQEQAPFFFQAKNESETYNKDIKFLLSEIASKVHVSAQTLAPFISEKAGLNQKTAEEINSEENETRMTISTKRELISHGLEKVLTQIAICAGKESDEIHVVFNNEEVSNPIKEINLIGRRLELNLTSQERAIRRANRHLSKREVEQLIQEIKNDELEEHKRKMELKDSSTTQEDDDKLSKQSVKGIPAP